MANLCLKVPDDMLLKIKIDAEMNYTSSSSIIRKILKTYYQKKEQKIKPDSLLKPV